MENVISWDIPLNLDVKAQKTHKHSYYPNPAHVALKAPLKFVFRKQVLKLRKTVKRDAINQGAFIQPFDHHSGNYLANVVKC